MPSPLQAVADELEAGTFNFGVPPPASATPAEREAARQRALTTAAALVDAFVKDARAAGRTEAEIDAGLVVFLASIKTAVDNAVKAAGKSGGMTRRNRKRKLSRRR